MHTQQNILFLFTAPTCTVTFKVKLNSLLWACPRRLHVNVCEHVSEVTFFSITVRLFHRTKDHSILLKCSKARQTKKPLENNIKKKQNEHKFELYYNFSCLVKDVKPHQVIINQNPWSPKFYFCQSTKISVLV